MQGDSVAKGSFADAVSARDTKLKEIGSLSAKERNQIAAIVGGVNTQTGETATGVKKTGEAYGKCAEDLCVEALSGSPGNILLSPAIRPRTGEEVPVCRRCQTKYTRDQFPPGTPFEE
jgi:hypothetical protein